MGSRKRNHYIPRFLLNKFASRSQGPTFWIWQIRADGATAEVSTRDAAVSRMFYGARELGIESKYDLQENIISPIISAIISGESPSSHHEKLRVFLYHLSVRTRAARGQLARAFHDMMSLIESVGSTPKYKTLFIASLNNNFYEHLFSAMRTYPPDVQSILRNTIIHNPMLVDDLKKKMICYLNSSHFDDAYQKFYRDATLHLDFNRVSVNGHISGLERLLTTNMVPELFKPSTWHVITSDDELFILSDAGVVAINNDNVPGPLYAHGNKWKEAYLPINPHTMLVGMKEPGEPTLSIDEINRIGASLSYDAIYSAVRYDRAVDIFELIGGGKSIVNNEKMLSILDNVLENMARPRVN